MGTVTYLATKRTARRLGKWELKLSLQRYQQTDVEEKI